MTTLYGYWRSTAAYRVRIALNLKGIKYESLPVRLTRKGGEHRSGNYREINPQRLVPTLVEGDARIAQSLAVIEYLEEVYPDPSLLPRRCPERRGCLHRPSDVQCEAVQHAPGRVPEAGRNRPGAHGARCVPQCRPGKPARRRVRERRTKERI